MPCLDERGETQMPDWLLKFGMGGVQELISQRRKTRDLTAGSMIVARCAFVAVDFARRRGAILRLPTVVPNEILCPHQLIFYIPSMDREGVRQFGADLLEAVRLKWSEWVLDQFNSWRENEKTHSTYHSTVLAEAKSANPENNPLFKNHIDTALEAYWVAVESVTGEERVAFERLLRLFDDRRHTRTFRQLEPIGSDKAWTCSLCGVRPALLQPPESGWGSSRVFVTKAEKLCLICIARRWWALGATMDCIHVPSTHLLAKSRFFSDSALDEFRTKQNADIWMDVFDHISELENPDLVESETHTRSSPATNGKPSTRANDSIVGLLSAFRDLKQDEAAYRLVSKLPNYYAVIALDGDEMGRWFSGDEAILSPDALKTGGGLSEFQRKLSEALMQFATDLSCFAKAAQPYNLHLV